MVPVALETEKHHKIDDTALITGSEAIAVACKLADVDVITAYPIRPYDTVMQYVAKLVAEGEMDCEYIVAEGEHSQFEVVKHASACGARVFCGSSGVGWMYAMEALTVTPALRIPMVAMVGNRALDDPGAFGVEHNDALAVRDLGWQLVWVDNPQEALDTALIAYRVAEDRRIFLPCAISCDGAFLTHSQALVKVPSQEKVNEFLPRYNRAELLLHPDNPITVAPQGNEDWVMEIRRQNYAAMERTFGSPYLGGVVAGEVRNALYPSPGKKPPVLGFIAGLGGREVTVPDVEKITAAVYRAAQGKSEPLTQWIGLRE